ncbi:unnamed protein product [Pleuronectes platessa]|uniref:Uncharacterized protein n=1 Tax=Pleuronectes platessa TaxID=8262 RepID=A0A9N7YCI3_PLEPL|nr:unnamed protein product [Pleuronectes platessa]
MERNKVRNTREDRLKVKEEKWRTGGEQRGGTIKALRRPAGCESAEGVALTFCCHTPCHSKSSKKHFQNDGCSIPSCRIHCPDGGVTGGCRQTARTNCRAEQSRRTLRRVKERGSDPSKIRKHRQPQGLHQDGGQRPELAQGRLTSSSAMSQD